MSMALVWQVLYIAWIVSEVLIAVGTRTRSGKGSVQDRGTLFMLWIVIVASLTAGSWFAEVSEVGRLSHGPLLRNVSVGLLSAGLLLRWSAVLSLGKAFSSNVAIRDAQRVRTTGLYRWMRHPSYSGLILLFLAVGVHTRNWIALLVIVAPTTVMLLYRIHVEELALRRHFGAEYIEYSKRTKRLLPGLY